ncbi:MAG: IS1096 element passenger TnpR family protein [Acidobacteriota bacterium]
MRYCPPEDCGGPWGYADFLEAIGNPEHERHEEFVEWVGGRHPTPGRARKRAGNLGAPSRC